MPIYEYECGACGGVHEILQKMSDKPMTKCPECDGALHKRISQCTFHLKGTGWYVTDYANGSKIPSSTGTSKKDDSSSSGESSAGTKSTTSGKEAKATE